mgnify:CR=1 FL=1
MKCYLLAFIGLSMASCSKKQVTEEQISLWKAEIEQTELAFSKLAGEQGIHDAFVAYAAPEAVLLRRNKLILGRTEIDDFYSGNTSTGLSWAPDFVDVAESGDLGYTYGKYIFSFKDSTGTQQQNQGIFHTVWKRQEDGTWKFVWD